MPKEVEALAYITDFRKVLQEKSAVLTATADRTYACEPGHKAKFSNAEA